MSWVDGGGRGESHMFFDPFFLATYEIFLVERLVFHKVELFEKTVNINRFEFLPQTGFHNYT